MLRELSIKNFAIIDNLNVSFSPGLNVLTGETGAGKSILVDAIELILGARASFDLIRKGARESIIETAFEIKNRDIPRLKDIGIDEEEIIIRRIINQSGKSRVYINEHPVNISTLSEIGEALLDIHGQHEHQSLLSQDRQMDLLDSFGGLKKESSEVQGLFYRLKALRDEMRGLESGERERAQREDLLRFQKREIEGARLRVGEDLDLERQKNILSNAERLASLSSDAYSRLYSSERSILETLSIILNSIKEISQMDPSLSSGLERLENSILQLEDLAHILRDYKERIEFDPKRLEEIEERLDLIMRLRRKYGSTVEEILEFYDKVNKELDRVEGRTERIEEIKGEIEGVLEELTSKAKRLSEERATVSKEIEKKIAEELFYLGMKDLSFLVRLTKGHGEDTLDGYRIYPNGIDRVEFLISNPGEEPRPLAKIASGGELSRVMLSLKTILAGVDDNPTLIFDEVDAGIGGKTADAVGRRLKLISKDRQVLCITHLPQIASLAGRHLLVEKEVRGGRTVAKVKSLDEKERVKEIARMLGGKTITDITLQHAEEMMRAGLGK